MDWGEIFRLNSYRASLWNGLPRGKFFDWLFDLGWCCSRAV